MAISATRSVDVLAIPGVKARWGAAHYLACFGGLMLVAQAWTYAGWLAAVRRWTLVSWFFLTVGITLGMWWAYVELGWGGYWAWDPVENSSLLPWLTTTAFLHSIMIQERRGMMKVWNVSLVIVTFVLTMIGTFMTRSGIVQSVHAFGQDTELAIIFLIFISAILIFSFGLVIYRLPLLRSRNELDSWLSREFAFLINNWVLLSAAFFVLIATLFPTLLLAGVLLPLEGAPGWLRAAADLNPLGYIIEAERALFAGDYPAGTVLSGAAAAAISHRDQLRAGRRLSDAGRQAGPGTSCGRFRAVRGWRCAEDHGVRARADFACRSAGGPP